MGSLNFRGIKDKTTKAIQLRYLILMIFIILVFGMTVFIMSIIFSNWQSSAETTTVKISDDLNREIIQKIDIFINRPLENNSLHKGLLENDVINLSKQEERESFFVLALQNLDTEIYSFSFGSKDGHYYGARRNAGAVIEIMRNDETTDGHSWYYSVDENFSADELVLQTGYFDPRTRDWYKVAAESGLPAFSPVYKHFVMNDLTVSAASPVNDNNGRLQGVLGTHIILSNINQFLDRIVTEYNGYAVIVEIESGKLIANTLGMENFFINEEGKFLQRTIEDLNHTAIIDAYYSFISDGESRQKLAGENDELFISLTEYEKSGLSWLVITAIPESVFMEGITENMRLTAVLTIIGVAFFAIIYIWMTAWFLKPISYLIDATEKLSQGDLSSRVKIFRHDEIGRISASFNKMADTIHSLVNELEEKVRERTFELETANRTLRDNKNHLQLILDSTAEGIYGIDTEGHCTFCNTSSLKILEYKHQDDLLGKNMHRLIHYKKKDNSVFPLDECRIIKSIKEGEGTHADNEVFWRADGNPFDAEYHSYPQFKDGKIVGAVVTFMDITEGKKASEKIKYLSNHDTLTGLHNRSFYEDALKRIDTSTNLPISIIFGDVNGLKLANDVFGHGAGDELLIKSAEILKRVCREDDIVARIGGDEFTIILPRTNEETSQKIIDRVKTELAREEIATIKCSMALGASTKTAPEETLSDVIVSAENEMYRIKTLNRKTIHADLLENIFKKLHGRSPREKNHSESVSRLCGKFGHALKLPDTEVAKLKEAGYYHDIGKIVLDESILNKKGTLTDEEGSEMQQHPVVGYRIINLFDEKLDLAEGIFSHHERWDGKGYPKGLKGNDIPLIARIIAIAEFYDSFMMYRSSACKQDALDEIKRLAGSKFDPEIVQTFIEMILSD